MTLFWIILGLVFILVTGNALVLLRTAKKPRIPQGVKPQPYDSDEED
jgi:hypothetical protein